MKKYTFQIVTSLFIGIFMAYFVINQYNSLESITLSSSASKIYLIQKGIYSDKANMENNMKEFQNYIYNVQNNMYYTYIGISQSMQNVNKIQDFYKKQGYETSIQEKIVDSDEFIDILAEYDNVLSKTNDEESIKVICQQVLAQYEEYVNGKYKN